MNLSKYNRPLLIASALLTTVSCAALPQQTKPAIEPLHAHPAPLSVQSPQLVGRTPHPAFPVGISSAKDLTLRQSVDLILELDESLDECNADKQSFINRNKPYFHLDMVN